MTEQERAAASAENYKRMRAELDRRLSLDPELRSISKKIKDGTADFNDTFRYSELVSKHIGAVMQAHIGEITNPLGKQYVCEELLKDHYEMINNVYGTVQVHIDEELGIHLKPIKPPKPLERIQQVAHALEDPGVKPEVIKRRAGAPVVNTAMSMHDSCIKINARKRNDLGFKCYLTRVAVGGCCKWCTEIAGRYVYGDHPADIFRRHDNCDCTVTFENGRQRQDVWSKRTWDANDPQEVMQNASEPTVLSQDAAENLQNTALGRLTLAGERDIINTKPMRISMQTFGNRNIPRMSDRELQKSIESWTKRAEEHKEYIENPIIHCPDWESYDPRKQAGLKQHWEKEIQNFNEDIQAALDELERREKS